MLREDAIKFMLFTMLGICSIFYLSMGIYSYMRDKKSKINLIFLTLCISNSLWSIGYAFMLISPNIEIANIWRIVSALGWCFFSPLWISFVFSLKGINQKNSSLKIQLLLYMASIIFFISNFVKPSKVVNKVAYGFVDNLYTTTLIGTVFSIYVAVLFIVGLVIIYLQMRSSKKNRVKKQLKTILITSFISFCLVVISDLIFPALGIVVYPSGIIAISIGMGGMWYAINKHRLMSISAEFLSEYIFEVVKEPIFILDEDFIIKNCNVSTLNITGYNFKDLEQNTLDTIINFRDINFNNTMKSGDIINIEVDLHRKNREALVCELSATVIYDEYKDILGILILLHDVSERKRIAEIQNKYTLELEKSNTMLKNEITDRLLAEKQIRHLVYYDALTELSNRKKILEDVNILLDYKHEKFAVLFIDLDKFKSVNDNYGHQAGDSVLKTVAMRLKAIVTSIDTVGRIGGDEFIIILRDLESTTNAVKVAVTVVEALSSAFYYKENQLFIGGSIGISIFPKHGIDADTLIKRADLAMYEVKCYGGSGYKIYSSEIED